MANRSDVLGPLPRATKRMLAMGEARGYIASKDAPSIRRSFAAAHALYKAFKLRRNLDASVKADLKAVADAEKAAADTVTVAV